MKHVYKGHVVSMIKRCATEVGQSIEEIVREAVAGNKPIDNVVPMVYTEEKDGVLPQYDIRTDRTEIALDAIDKFQKSEIAKSKETPIATEENK